MNITNIKVIISLRTEQKHELEPFESLIPPFAATSVVLEDVEDQFIPDVIDTGNIEARRRWDREAITPAAAAEIHKWWAAARTQDDLIKELPPGLLNLQGLLYVLDDIAGDTAVDMHHLREVQRTVGAEIGDTADSVSRFFALALSRAADIKLQRCRSACRSFDVDEYLVEGTTTILTRVVPHLASAGYKLVRNLWELAGLALENEIRQLRRGISESRVKGSFVGDGVVSDEQLRALFEVVIRSVVEGDEEEHADEDEEKQFDSEGEDSQTDALASTSQELAAAADDASNWTIPWTDRFHEAESPFDADPEDVTSGPLMGRSPTFVIIEEFRRFAFAMEWLRVSHLVRFNIPTQEMVTVALIHDGFGVALNRLAEQRSKLPDGALHALTAAGDAFEWNVSDDDLFRPEFNGTKPCLVVEFAVEGRKLRENGLSPGAIHQL